jgi:glycosyltransferase involved in cell wall biosynthesis
MKREAKASAGFKNQMKKIKVLFVCSGNNVTGISPNVAVQAKGLADAGVEVVFFEIKGKGWKGYLKNIFRLRRYLKNHSYDVVHAHYGLSGMAASLAGAGPLAVTIMGSELYLNSLLKVSVQLFSRFVWKTVIVQSEEMRKMTSGNAVVLPNGVDLSLFKNIDREEAKEITGFSKGKHVIWVSAPDRPEKNFVLAEEAVKELSDDDVFLDVVNRVPHDVIPNYFAAADAMLLTSKWEGSPIVVKEALAAGLPVVSVDVGDVKALLSGVDGCYVTDSNAGEIADALRKALSFGRRTDGLIKVEHLDMKNVSEKLKAIYRSLVTE